MDHAHTRLIAAIAACCCALALSVAPVAVRAQAAPLPEITPVTGTIGAGAEREYTFSGAAGEVVTLRMDALDPTLDPALRLFDSAGRLLTAADDRAYPEDRDALIEGFVLPRTDTYTLRARGVGGTVGDYALTRLPGYGDLTLLDDFETTTWRSEDDRLGVRRVSETLQLDYTGGRGVAPAFDTAGTSADDLYAEISVTEATGSGWITGLALRADRDAETYYAVLLNAAGSWRALLVSGGAETVLRDWTPHPAIRPGIGTFRLGAAVRGGGIDVFYDRALIGSFDEPALTTGAVGVIAGTTSGAEAAIRLRYDRLIVTRPLMTTPPEQVAISDGRSMAQSLRTRLGIGAGGAMRLTLENASVDSARAGVGILRLGRGLRLERFAMGGFVEINTLDALNGGCALLFDVQDETTYSIAYLTGRGDYGVAQRVGDEFAGSLYGLDESLAITPPTTTRRHLLIVADGVTLIIYIDGRLRGTLPMPVSAGEIGIATVNYEPTTTRCAYTNLWLWSW